jgi:hypothetical protein
MVTKAVLIHDAIVTHPRQLESNFERATWCVALHRVFATMDSAAIAQQIMDARDLAAAGQPTSALVYFAALLPQLARCARALLRVSVAAPEAP